MHEGYLKNKLKNRYKMVTVSTKEQE